MSTLTSPITGTAQSGFTAPTYTHVADVAPRITGRQVAVSALGGTQTGVTFHSASNPFTITLYRPESYKTLGKANPVTGVIKDVPMNVYQILVRKGMVPLAGQSPKTGLLNIKFEIPAGADLASPAEIRAMISAGFGAVSQISSAWGDTLVSGVL
jgi:hypothetical protein